MPQFQVTKKFATSCGLSLESSVAIAAVAKLAGHVVKISVLPAGLIAALQVILARTLCQKVLYPRLATETQEASETHKRLADIAAHLVIGGALYLVAVKVGLIAATILPALSLIALTGIITHFSAPYMHQFVKFANQWQIAREEKNEYRARLQAKRDVAASPETVAQLRELYTQLGDKVDSLQKAYEQIFQMKKDNLLSLTKFFKDKDSLNFFAAAVRAAIDLKQLEKQRISEGKPEPVFIKQQHGLTWAIFAPMHIARDAGASSQDFYSAFLQKIKESGADAVINLEEFSRSLIEDLPNYVRYLSPKASDDEKLNSQPSSTVRASTPFIASVGYFGKLPILHLDGLVDGDDRALAKPEIISLLRAIKQQHKVLSELAAKKGCKIEDLKIVVHCRQGLQRTPFYMALMTFINNPDLVNVSDEGTIHNFMLFIAEYHAMNYPTATMGSRLPPSAMVREFCKPEFLEALTEVANDL